MGKFRSAFEHDLTVGLTCKSVSRVKQAFGPECDINAIMARYAKTGVFPSAAGAPIYADVSGIADYQQCLQVVKEAEETFDALPASIRERFGNSPAQLIAFLSNDENREEAIKLGLVEVEPPPVVVPPVVPQEVQKGDKHE